MKVLTFTNGQQTDAVDVPVSVESSNADALHDKAVQALTSNATFLALATPSNTQVSAQVKALTRQVNAVLRLLVVGDTSTIADS